ncbi:MAG: DMT family transporter [Pseudomonadota bacterium]
MTRAAVAHPGAAGPAIALMFAAGALIAATSLIAKALGLPDGGSPGLSPFQISAGRFVFALAALLLFVSIAPAKRPSIKGARWSWHILRSVCGWLGVTCMFAAVVRMPVAEATAISFLSPLVAMLLAVLMLGENVGSKKILAAGLAVAGAALILRPGSDAFQFAGLFALAAALFMGAETIFIKRLSDSEPALRVLLINNSIGAWISVVAGVVVWSWPTAGQWLLLICVGVVMVCGQALFIQAMRRGEASFVMPAFYSVLAFAALYDFALYRVVPGWSAIIGAGLIVAGAMILVVRAKRKQA